MAQMRAGEAIIEGLRAEGVEYIFGLVGTTTNSIVTELPGRTDIRFLDTRHEEEGIPCLTRDLDQDRRSA